MKLKLDENNELLGLSVRGVVDDKMLRVLATGIESILKKDARIILINFSCAECPPTVIAALQNLKKLQEKINNKAKIYWIHKDRTLGDFATVDLLFSRLQGARYRQIGHKISIDDQMDAMTEERAKLEQQFKELAGDDANSQAAIIENANLKATKAIFTSMLSWRKERLEGIVPHLSEEEDRDSQIKDARSSLLNTLEKASLLPDGKKAISL
jgi:hypothetical protein